ncbi:MAG: glycosyltransferase family 4 protein [Chloroflexi bacterium]|nr:glycosyltransferase family 4 protein [Chloroflexota bacterium]
MRVCFMAFRSIHTQRCLDWFVRKGHEVHLITHQPQQIDGARVHDISFRTSAALRWKRYLSLDLNHNLARRLRLVFQVRNLVREINPDVLHLHTLYFPCYYGAFAAARPLVISPWNGDVIWTPKRPWYHRAIVGYALRRADAVTADNQTMRDTCHQRYRVPEERIHEIRWFGVDTKHFYPRGKDASLMKRLRLESSPVVLSTRALSPGYNVDALVRAMPLVLEEAPEAKFVFLWPGGELVEVIADLIRQLGVESAARLVGRVDHSELPSYYGSADVTVSIASPDSISASLFEGMACGTAPVVGDEPAVTEFVKDGWNGWVVPPRDHVALAQAIVKLIKDGETRQTFVERNLALVKDKADFDGEMGKIEALYYALRGKTGGRFGVRKD